MTKLHEFIPESLRRGATLGTILLAQLGVELGQATSAAGQSDCLVTASCPPVKKPPINSIKNCRNPLRQVMEYGSLYSLAVDEGVDYGGHGDVYGACDGKVTFAGRGKWFGKYGWSVVYRLTDGPARGKSIYFSEACKPKVHVGEKIHTDTVICQMHADKKPWAETGWASGKADYPVAYYHGYKNCPTAYGVNFSNFMHELGAPAGNNECHGRVDERLPPKWPPFPTARGT